MNHEHKYEVSGFHTFLTKCLYCYTLKFDPEFGNSNYSNIESILNNTLLS